MQTWMAGFRNFGVQALGTARFARSLVLGAALAGVGIASSAFAGFTTIQPNPSSENSQPMVLGHVYGGTFSLEPDGVDYTNGSLTAVRVSDFLPSTSTSDNPGPNATDQTWQSSRVSGSAEAVFAEDPSSPFGYIPGATGGSFTSLFTVTGSGYAVSGSGSFSPGSQIFRFAAQNPFGLLSSLPSDNKDGKDHMVTYEVDGLNDGLNTWLLFFDDYGNNGMDGDFDYQDLVIQVKTAPQSTVPEPGSLMVIGGVAMGLLKRLPRRVR